MSFYDYRAMVEDTPIETFIVEFRDPDDRMVGACLVDKLGDGLSAVYSFFAPGLERRSLGTYTDPVADRARRALGLPYVYLGYWVPESRKMAYKARFRPAEVLAGGSWRMLTDADLRRLKLPWRCRTRHSCRRRQTEPAARAAWLVWAREIQATAQTGLAFTKDPYDAERYQSLRALAARILASHTIADAPRVEALVRGGNRLRHAEARRAWRRVRHAGPHPAGARDGGRRALDPARRLGGREPDAGAMRRARGGGGIRLCGAGGEAGGGLGPRDAAAYAAFGVLDRQAVLPVPAGRRRCTAPVWRPARSAGSPRTNIPSDLSLGRTLPHQIARMFVHWRQPELATDFE